MKVGAARCLSLALQVMMIMILLKTSSCRASTSSLNNDSYTGSGLIADDLETEVLMDSDFTRILASSPKLAVSAISGKRAVCGRAPYASSCTDAANKPIKKDNCPPGRPNYNRICYQLRHN